MTRREGGGVPKRPNWYRWPPHYKGNPDAIIGPEDPIPFPYYSDKLDLELEIGIVVGKGGRNLSLEQARQAIAGYTILIDCSARDPHLRQAEFLGPAKMKDWATVLGPCLVTADEVDEASLDVRITVDGEVWFEGNSSAPRLNGPDYPATLGIMRPVFHRVLADATREAGMQVRLGVTVEAIEPRPRLSRRSWPRRPAIPPSG